MTPMIFDHPLIQHKISLLRNKNTGSKEFRELVGEVSMLMCYEATRDLPLKEVEIETPVALGKDQGHCRQKTGIRSNPACRYRYARRRAVDGSCC